MKIKTLIYGLVGAVALPLIVVAAFLIASEYAGDRAQAKRSVEYLADRVGDDMNRRVSETESVLAAVAARLSVRALDGQSCDAGLEIFKSIDPTRANLAIADRNGRLICAAVPMPGGTRDVSDVDWYRQVMAENRFVVSNPRLGWMTGKLVAVLAHPVRDETGRPIGAVILPYELEKFHAVLNLAPSPPRTAVTVVDREGHVIAHSPDADWAGRDIRDHAIVRAALSGGGAAAVGHTADGAEVVFAYRQIPHADWVVLASIPTEVVFAHARASAVRAGLAVSVVLLLIGLLAAILIRRIVGPLDGISATARAVATGDLDARMPLPSPAEYAVVARQFNAMLDIREQSERRFRDLFEGAPDGIALIDTGGAIGAVNARFEEMFGYSGAELRGRSVELLLPERMRARHVGLRTAFQNAPATRMMGEGSEFLACRKDGTEFSAEVSLSPLSIPEGSVTCCAVRDVTKRVRDQSRILKLNRMYAALSQTNHAITNITDRGELLAEVCRIAVEHGQLALAWIGFVDPVSGCVTPETHAGRADSYLKNLHISIDPTSPTGQGPSARAIREARPALASDIWKDARMVPWHAAAQAHGLRSSAAFPIVQDGKAVGVVNLYSDEPDYFKDPELLKLAAEITGELSFALDGLHHAAIHRETEGRLRQIAESSSEIFWLTDTASGRVLYISPAYEKIWGRSIEALYAAPNTLIEAIHPDDRARVVEALRARQTSGGYDEEYRIVRPSGEIRWLHARTFPVRDAGGHVYRVAGIAEDFTARKAAADRIHESEHRIAKLYRMYSTLSRTNHAITHVTDRQRLLSDICAIAVENTEIVLAWIGFLDPESLEMDIAAIAGPATPYLANALFSKIDLQNLEQQGPIHRAMRENKPEVRADITNDPWFASRREAAIRHKVASLVTYPLTSNGVPIGVLNLYASEAHYFDDPELLQLMAEMAGDLSFALDGLTRDATHEESQQRFRQIAETIREVFWLTDIDKGKTLYISPAYREIWGRSDEQLYLSPSTWLDAVVPEDRDRVREAAFTKQISGEYDEEYRIARPDGEIRWIRDRAFPIRNSAGRVYRLAGVAEDVTDRRKILDEVRISEQRLESVLTSISDSCFVVDHDFNFTYLNPQTEILLRRQRGDLIGRNLLVEFPGAVGTPFETNLQLAIARNEPVHFIEYYPPLEAWLEVHIFPSEKIITVFLRDVTERKKQEEDLAFLAQYDTLTRLPNRSLFRDRLHQAMLRARRSESNLALMFLDLNRFKEINDTLGHGIGDKVLEGVADRLREHLREADTIARIGGDEFTIIVENLEKPEQAESVARKVQDALAAPMMVEGNEIYVAASIGIVLYPQESDDLDGLIRKADIAMYQAKLVGGSAYQMYTGSQAKPANVIEVESRLRRALERNEFTLHYQPQVEIATGRVIGAEALLRWTNPDLGSVSPARFIPLAEETGLIVEIGEWVMRTAARQARAWQLAGLGPLPISVNMSARQFRRKDIAQTVAAILKEAELDPALFEIEITESTIMHNTDMAISTLNELSEMGIELSIDDFGTGYSSLAYLRNFPLDKLKIDRAFVRDIETNSADATIVRAIVALADGLNLKIVAEGVETEGQMQRLKDFSVKAIQGYYYSRPIPADEFEVYLRRKMTE